MYEVDRPKFFPLEISCPRGAIGRTLDLGSKGLRFESRRGFLKVWAKKIWCGRIFLYGYSEPLDINIEGLDSILLGKEPFIQIHFGGLWCIKCKNSILHHCRHLKIPATFFPFVWFCTGQNPAAGMSNTTILYYIFFFKALFSFPFLFCNVACEK